MSTARTKAGYSLQARLVLAFGLTLILFLGLAGFILNQSFKRSAMAALEERLQLQVYALLGVAEVDAGEVFVPDLEEPRYRQIDSGLYALILNADGEERWRSPSALNLSLPADGLTTAPIDPGAMRFGTLTTPSLGELAYARYDIVWARTETRYRFVVLESTETVAAEIRGFQASLWFWLGGLAVLLSLVQLVLLRWGLAPVKRLAAEVRGVEQGDQEALEGDYPQELAPLSDNMNRLIQSERARQERYQRTLGDLAHSLKTPLAVVSGIVEEEQAQGRQAPSADIQEQVQRMNQIVSYQLKRAVSSGQHAWLPRPVPVAPQVEKVLQALSKVYRDKGVRVEKQLDPGIAFHGEESDLMEILGNLLDNAFKYTHSLVRVVVEKDAGQWWLRIEDDGPGVSREQQRWILQRGARADTASAGQGIGLAVVVEIVSQYEGQLDIQSSPEGGAGIRVTFRMPA